MTLTADALPDTAPLGRDLLAQVREERSSVEASERRILQLAVEYAAANPALPGQEAWQPADLPVWTDPASADTDPEDVEWHGLPALRWDAPAAFAAANAMTTVAGKAVIRDALVLRHRAPGVWAAAQAGLLTTRIARKVAEQLLGQHDDVCRYVNDAVVERIREGRHLGPVVVEGLVDEAMLRLHCEERELQQIEALDKRHVTVDLESINYTGIVQISAAADLADAAPFDDALSAVADAIKDLPEYHALTHDERRSVALAILADPPRAQAVLAGCPDARPTTRRELAGVLNLTDGNLLGIDPVITDGDLKARLTQLVAQWSGRHDIALTIKTLWHCGGRDGGCTDCPAHIDCDDHAREGYVPSKRDREIVERANVTCVHPYCRRKARHCDCDHVVAFDPDNPDRGPTCPTCNLAPLCRHHHRLKTLTGWRYWKLDLQTYLWMDPHGLLYLRTRDGTRTLD